MASHDALVRERLLLLEAEGSILSQGDEVSLWRKLFVSNIFQIPTIRQHTWVIDALDECANFNALFTKKTLSSDARKLAPFCHESRPGRDWAGICVPGAARGYKSSVGGGYLYEICGFS